MTAPNVCFWGNSGHYGMSALPKRTLLRVIGNRSYAFFDIDRRNFPVLIRFSRSILTRRLVCSLVRPVANISFIGVQ